MFVFQSYLKILVSQGSNSLKFYQMFFFSSFLNDSIWMNMVILWFYFIAIKQFWVLFSSVYYVKHLIVPRIWSDLHVWLTDLKERPHGN